MVRCSCCTLALLVSFSLSAQTAEAQQFAFGAAPRALCVTDPYGAAFQTWYGSPVAYNSYFYSSLNSGYASGYNATTNGYFWGGVPAVASATTSEWIVQRTSVFPVGAYSTWPVHPGAYGGSWTPRIGSQRSLRHSPSKVSSNESVVPTDNSRVLHVSGSAETRSGRRRPQASSDSHDALNSDSATASHEDLSVP